MVGGGEYCLFLREEGIFLPQGGICRLCIKIPWLRGKVKSFQSSRSTLIFVTAVSFPFTEPSVLGFLYTSMERRKRDSLGRRLHPCGQGWDPRGHQTVLPLQPYSYCFSLINCCQVIWKLAVIGHCLGAFSVLGRGNALSVHACQVRTLSTS